MQQSHVRRLAATFLLSASVIAGGVGLSSAQQTPATDTLQASIFATSCADLSGEAVETLRNLTLDHADAEFRGLPSAMVVLDSDSEVEISLVTMLDSPHSIVIGDPNSPVACGDIGGHVPGDDDDDSDIEVGLWPWNDSGYFGIAHIEGENDLDDDDDDSNTEIDIEVAVPNQ
ncbi:MAG: hypothetical protein IT334_02945 [Thermomicrobiales bacterium]|nr:hypothetical protein [Thermomicrobiales bacterium]